MIFIWLCRRSEQVFLIHEVKCMGIRYQDGFSLPSLASLHSLTSQKMYSIFSSQLKHICYMAHTCACQMACGDTVSRVDWLHAIRLQMQLAHRPAAMSLYITVSLLSPAHTRALTLVLGDNHTPVPCHSSLFTAYRQHMSLSTCTQVTYGACGDDCHVHHVQARAKYEQRHYYNTDPTYTVMFLCGSNSHRIPSLEIVHATWGGDRA